MQRGSAFVESGGRPVAWLGANFWSRAGGPRMWSRYDGDVVDAELRVLRDHGLTVTRSFLYWPEAHPEPDRVDHRVLDRVEDFLDRHTALGLTSVPTFIVGHMSGQNWDPAWRHGEDLYGDTWLLGRQAFFVHEVVRRFRDHPAVAGWLLSNEMPIYGRPPHEKQPAAPHTEVQAWVQTLVHAARAAGATQPVSTGDGAWGVEMTGVDNGFRVREIAPLVDFLGPHVYRMETDRTRQHLAPAFVCELAGFTGLPVVLEEFGVSTDFVSDRGSREYYRQVLHSTLLAGATGWIAWNNTDYDALAAEEPYLHHAFEMHFGVTDRHGAPKGPLFELRDFRAVLDAIDVTRCSRPDTDVALLLPAAVEADFPFVDDADRTAPVRSLHQAYVAARGADLPVAVVREVDGVPDDLRLLIAPSVKMLTTAGWSRLRELAAAGAVVHVSWFAGDHDVQRGPWYSDLDDLFGVEQQLTYGLAEPITGDTVTWTFTSALGDIPAGTELTFAVGGSDDARSYLPVTPAGAEVLAVDDHGRPALLRHRVGAGWTVLSTYPVEYLAARTPRVNPEPTSRLYDALALEAGVVRDVRVEDPAVHTGELRHEDGRRFVWLISQSAQPLVVKPVVAPGLRLRPLAGGDDVDPPENPPIALAPYGVEVHLLEHVEGTPS
ncbi:cellulase family glycosylhydrolase [Jatrophihabitans sp. YIM 134969]